MHNTYSDTFVYVQNLSGEYVKLAKSPWRKRIGAWGGREEKDWGLGWEGELFFIA